MAFRSPAAFPEISARPRFAGPSSGRIPARRPAFSIQQCRPIPEKKTSGLGHHFPLVLGIFWGHFFSPARGITGRLFGLIFGSRGPLVKSERKAGANRGRKAASRWAGKSSVVPAILPAHDCRSLSRLLLAGRSRDGPKGKKGPEKSICMKQ